MCPRSSLSPSPVISVPLVGDRSSDCCAVALKYWRRFMAFVHVAMYDIIRRVLSKVFCSFNVDLTYRPSSSLLFSVALSPLIQLQTSIITNLWTWSLFPPLPLPFKPQVALALQPGSICCFPIFPKCTSQLLFLVISHCVFPTLVQPIGFTWSLFLVEPCCIVLCTSLSSSHFPSQQRNAAPAPGLALARLQLFSACLLPCPAK